MTNMQAYGCFLQYCNNNYDPTVTENYQQGAHTILNSPEGRFEHCRYMQDVVRELGWEPVEKMLF